VPIDVDVDQRLREIAEATLAVVEEDTARGVTIRAVAAKLGRSTTVVTNYLPTRSALLLNAVRHALMAWDEDQREVDDAHDGPDALRHNLAWAVSTEGHDMTVRRLFLELVATSDPGADAALPIRAAAAEGRDELEQAARGAGSADPGFVADALFLALRGFYLACVEDPERWTSERAAPVVDRLLTVLLAATPPVDRPPR
jgi:AcrR family transcriptional regulator